MCGGRQVQRLPVGVSAGEIVAHARHLPIAGHDEGARLCSKASRRRNGHAMGVFFGEGKRETERWVGDLTAPRPTRQPSSAARMQSKNEMFKRLMLLPSWTTHALYLRASRWRSTRSGQCSVDWRCWQPPSPASHPPELLNLDGCVPLRQRVAFSIGALLLCLHKIASPFQPGTLLVFSMPLVTSAYHSRHD